MKQGIETYVREWESRCYFDGIPDVAPDRLCQLMKVPSWRRAALAILSNDVALKSLGRTPKSAKAYSDIKRTEIDARRGVKQLELLP